MEIKVPTLAERKAARRSQIQTTITQPNDTPRTIQPEPVSVIQSNDYLTSDTLHKVRMEAPVREHFPVNVKTSESNPLSKTDIIELARSMGLELAAPRKIWIKHSFSITPPTKEKFQEYCRALGYKMQDALEEALCDWFEKNRSDVSAIQKVKGPDGTEA